MHAFRYWYCVRTNKRRGILPILDCGSAHVFPGCHAALLEKSSKNESWVLRPSFMKSQEIGLLKYGRLQSRDFVHFVRGWKLPVILVKLCKSTSHRITWILSDGPLPEEVFLMRHAAQESVTFSFKSRTEEVILHGNKDDNAEFKRSVFILEVPSPMPWSDSTFIRFFRTSPP